MEQYVEEMVSKGLAQNFKLRGTAQAVFRMIQILAEFKPLVRDARAWEIWLVNMQN